MQLFTKKFCDKLLKKGLLEQELAKGKTIEDFGEIQASTMENLYQAAHHLFEKKEYTEAVNAFTFLILLNPNRPHYWLGLGMSTQMCGDFEAAINAYEMSAIYEPENPVPYFYLAKCLFAMHERQSALLALEMAIQYAGENTEYKELKNQALEAQEQLQRHIF